MRQSFFIHCFALLLCIACQSKQVDTAANDVRSDTNTKDTGSVNIDNRLVDEEEIDPYDLPNGTMIGIFEDAIFYAGATDFQFEIDGTSKLIRVANEVYMNIEAGKKVAGYDLPSDLLDQSEDLEGPPGGNPKWMGKKFEITIEDAILKIIPLE